MVFESFKPDRKAESQNMKTRLGFWIKAWETKFPYAPDFMIQNLDLQAGVCMKWKSYNVSSQIR